MFFLKKLIMTPLCIASITPAPGAYANIVKSSIFFTSELSYIKSTRKSDIQKFICTPIFYLILYLHFTLITYI